jgi:O-antigen ligase
MITTEVKTGHWYLISLSKINRFLSTLNFILLFIGYQFITSVLLPATSDIEGISRTVTVPYRAFALLVSFAVIIINFRRKEIKQNISLKIFLFYWGILILRMIYDVFLRYDVHLKDTTQLWFYVFGICLPAIFSLIKSHKFIDFEKSLYIILTLTAFSLIFTLFSNQLLFVSSESEHRQSANVALNTISFGHLGATGIILSIYVLFKTRLNFLIKTLVFLIIPIGIFCLLRAGSRGPVFALIAVMLFWYFSKGKNIVFSVYKVLVLLLLAVVFINQLLNLMGTISPVIESRMRETLFEGDMNERNLFYENSFNAFKESPIWGKQFAIFNADGSFSYSHNIILDSLMGLGIIGGLTIIFVIISAMLKSYKLIKYNDEQYWIVLILVQQIMTNMTSYSIYYNPLLSALLVFIFIYYRKYNRSNIDSQ